MWSSKFKTIIILCLSLFIIISFVTPSVKAYSYTLVDSFTTTSDGAQGLKNEHPSATSDMSATGVALTTGATSFVLGYIEFELDNLGSPTCNLTVAVYLVTGSVGTTAKPTGSALVYSDHVNSSTLGSKAWVVFNFSSQFFIIDANTNYAFAVEVNTTETDSSNYPRVWLHTGGGDADANRFRYRNSIWESTIYDHRFRLYRLLDNFPTFTQMGINQTYAGNSTYFYALVEDDYGLSGSILSHNSSSSWVNRTWRALGGEISAVANDSFSISSSLVIIAFKFIINDTSNNILVTEIFTFPTSTAAGDGAVDIPTIIVYGTEYRLDEDNGTIYAQVLDSSGDPANSASVNLTVRSNNGDKVVDNSSMPYLGNSNGIYFYNISLSLDEGVYIVDVQSQNPTAYGSGEFHINPAITIEDTSTLVGVLMIFFVGIVFLFLSFKRDISRIIRPALMSVSSILFFVCAAAYPLTLSRLPILGFAFWVIAVVLLIFTIAYSIMLLYMWWKTGKRRGRRR